MNYMLAFCAVLFLAGCAKHGLMIETGKDYKGNLSVGSMLDADVNGEFRACIPSEAGVKQEVNWCADWLKSRSPEGQ